MNPHFVAVVTGSSSGIGQATAVEFSRRGCELVIHGRSNLSGLSETASKIRQVSGNQSGITSMIADLDCARSSRSLLDAVFDRFGYVDAWVHAAGADVLTGSAKNCNFEEKLNRLWRTDVEGTMRLSRWVAGRMMQQPLRPQLPSMIHLGWDQSCEGMEGDSGQYFCAVKAAVSAFSKSLAKSVGPRVRVNCVAPGWIQTEWGSGVSQDWERRATGESILQRWGQPEDIARVIVALCSPDFEFVNGQTIAVNGGWQSMLLSVRSNCTWN
jgi:3-oxoacyl-[acyl-carrier protein] reductase